MHALTMISIALGLAMDAFSVALATSARLEHVTGRQVFRFAFHFGLFQAGMPVLGWLSGQGVSTWVAQWDHWVAFGLLGLVGGKAIQEGLRKRGGPGAPDAPGARPRSDAMGVDPTRGWSLVLLSVATSIDAFAVGIGLAALDEPLWLPALVIGLVTGVLTAVGMGLGRTAAARLGPHASVAGGVLLIAIGVKILLDHLG